MSFTVSNTLRLFDNKYDASNSDYKTGTVFTPETGLDHKACTPSKNTSLGLNKLPASKQQKLGVKLVPLNKKSANRPPENNLGDAKRQIANDIICPAVLIPDDGSSNNRKKGKLKPKAIPVRIDDNRRGVLGWFEGKLKAAYEGAIERNFDKPFFGIGYVEPNPYQKKKGDFVTQAIDNPLSGFAVKNAKMSSTIKAVFLAK